MDLLSFTFIVVLKKSDEKMLVNHLMIGIELLV